MRENQELASDWCKLGLSKAIGEDSLFKDGDWVESKDQDPNGDVRLIQLADIGDGFFRNRSDRYLTHKKALELGCTFLEKGDVLIARMPDPLGRACLFPGDSKKCVTVVDVCIIRTKNVEHKWLMYAINSPQFRADVESLQSGSTRKRISRKNLAKIQLPIPPKNDQHLLINKIEELFSQLDAGVAGLKRAQAELARYRASVLKAAFEGRLVPQDQKEYDLVAIEDLVQLIRGVSYSKNESSNFNGEDTLPILRATNIQNDSLLLNEYLVYIPSRFVKADQLLQIGDIVICMSSGSKHLVGKSAQLNSLWKGSFGTFCSVVRPKTHVNRKYLGYFFLSPIYREEIRKKSVGININNLKPVDITSIKIMLPSSAIQEKTVLEVEKQLTIINDLQRITDHNLVVSQRLKQAILKQAFEGRLIPHDFTN